MDVARAGAERLGDNEGDELDDGRVLGLLLQVLGRGVGVVERDVALGELLEHVVDGFLADLVFLGDGLIDGVAGGDDELDVAVGREAEVVERIEVEGVGDGDREAAVLARDGDEVVLAGHGLGHGLESVLLDVQRAGVDEPPAELHGEGLRNVEGRAVLQGEQGIAGSDAGVALKLQGLLELAFVDHPHLREDAPEKLASLGHSPSPLMHECVFRFPTAALPPPTGTPLSISHPPITVNHKIRRAATRPEPPAGRAGWR